MRRLAALMMTACLLLLQAHAIVPHHHHQPGTLEHRHPAGSIGSDWSESPAGELAELHPDVAPHNEAQASVTSRPQMPDEPAAMDLPNSAAPLMRVCNESVARPFPRGAIPYSTGPPGPKSSRAPPPSRAA